MRDFLRTLADALRVIFHGNTLNEVHQHYVKKYFANPHRNRLFQFEKIIKALRSGDFDKKDLTPEQQEWVSYTRKEFYIQLIKLYERFNYHFDVDRVREEGEKGSATVRQTKDGSETVVDDKGASLSAEVIKHGHTVDF